MQSKPTREYSITPPTVGPAGTIAKATFHATEGRATFLEHCDRLGRATHNVRLDNSKEAETNVTVYGKTDACVSVFTNAGGFSLCQQFTPGNARVYAKALLAAANHVEDLQALRQAEDDERDNATAGETEAETAVAP